jgi:hypothetical protein
MLGFGRRRKRFASLGSRSAKRTTVGAGSRVLARGRLFQRFTIIAEWSHEPARSSLASVSVVRDGPVCAGESREEDHPTMHGPVERLHDGTPLWLRSSRPLERRFNIPSLWPDGRLAGLNFLIGRRQSPIAPETLQARAGLPRGPDIAPNPCSARTFGELSRPRESSGGYSE